MERDTGLPIVSADKSPTTSHPAPETSKNLTLKQVIASAILPNKFTFIARVTDFNPLFLDEVPFLWCTKCKIESAPANVCYAYATLTSVCCRLRPGWKRCIDCDDMLETHCEWRYGLLFRLEDDEGCHVVVSVEEEVCFASFHTSHQALSSCKV